MITEIIHDAIKTAKIKYNADIFAIITDGNLHVNNNNEFNYLWFFECQTTIAKKIMKSLLNMPFILKVKNLMNAFNTPELKQEIIIRGGVKFELLMDDESCFFIKDILDTCMKNRSIMKQIVAAEEFRFQAEILVTLFDSSSFSSSSFEEDLRKFICLYEHICSLVSKCENPTSSIADITEEWLKIEAAIVDDICMNEICEQICLIISLILLTANFLHPMYKGHLFENNAERSVAIFEYLLEVLDSEGLDDYYDFLKKTVRKIVTTYNCRPRKILGLCGKKTSNLAKFALKLTQVPASIFQIKFQSLCINSTSDNNEKITELYHQLKLEDKNVTDKY